MPLVMIYSTPPADPEVIPNMISQVQKTSSDALKCSPDNIWVMFQNTPRDWFVQSQNPENNPPVVIIKAQAGRSRENLSLFAKTVSKVVGKNLRIPPEKVWIQYEEMKSNDVWFQGKWSN